MLKWAKFFVNHLKAQSTLLSSQPDVLIQQSRNTFILKRKYPIPLHKKYERRPKLTHKHFIYEVIEDTNVRRQKRIDLVLLETVKNVGERGEKVSVPYLKAYETLILPKLAVYATPENLEKYMTKDQDVKNELSEFSSQFVERTINLLSQCYLAVTMSMDIPWTLQKWHVRVCFRNAGYIVPEDAITLPGNIISGPDMSIENKEFFVTVKINNREEVKVRCRLLHHSSDASKKVKYDEPYFMLPSNAIFSEDQPILNTLPKHRLIIAQCNNVKQ